MLTFILPEERCRRDVLDFYREIQEAGGECIGCGKCAQICPQQCVAPGTPYHIAQEHCLHCGNCFEQCPVQAVTKKI